MQESLQNSACVDVQYDCVWLRRLHFPALQSLTFDFRETETRGFAVKIGCKVAMGQLWWSITIPRRMHRVLESSQFNLGRVGMNGFQIMSLHGCILGWGGCFRFFALSISSLELLFFQVINNGMKISLALKLAQNPCSYQKLKK